MGKSRPRFLTFVLVWDVFMLPLSFVPGSGFWHCRVGTDTAQKGGSDETRGFANRRFDRCGGLLGEAGTERPVQYSGSPNGGRGKGELTPS